MGLFAKLSPAFKENWARRRGERRKYIQTRVLTPGTGHQSHHGPDGGRPPPQLWELGFYSALMAMRVIPTSLGY